MLAPLLVLSSSNLAILIDCCVVGAAASAESRWRFCARCHLLTTHSLVLVYSHAPSRYSLAPRKRANPHSPSRKGAISLSLGNKLA